MMLWIALFFLAAPVEFLQARDLALLREAFAKLEGNKEFVADLRKVGGAADLLPAKDAERALRQAPTVTTAVHAFVKPITKKYLRC